MKIYSHFKQNHASSPLETMKTGSGAKVIALPWFSVATLSHFLSAFQLKNIDLFDREIVKLPFTMVCCLPIKLQSSDLLPGILRPTLKSIGIFSELFTVSDTVLNPQHWSDKINSILLSTSLTPSLKDSY